MASGIEKLSSLNALKSKSDTNKC